MDMLFLEFLELLELQLSSHFLMRTASALTFFCCSNKVNEVQIVSFALAEFILPLAHVLQNPQEQVFLAHIWRKTPPFSALHFFVNTKLLSKE